MSAAPAACPSWCTDHLDTEPDEPGMHRHPVSEIVYLSAGDFGNGDCVQILSKGLEHDLVGDAGQAREYAAELLAAADQLDAISKGRIVKTVTAENLAGRIWFTTEQAAEYTGWSTKTVVRALQANELRGQQRGAGCRWRVHRDWLDAWMRGEKA